MHSHPSIHLPFQALAQGTGHGSWDSTTLPFGQSIYPFRAKNDIVRARAAFGWQTYANTFNYTYFSHNLKVYHPSLIGVNYLSQGVYAVSENSHL